MEPKTIDKNSWLYKFCYGCRKKGPDEGDTCSLRVAFLVAFLVWPFFGYGAVAGCAIILLMFVGGFFFAARTNWEFISNDKGSPMKMYKHWPRWRGYRIMPIIPMAILGILWGLYALITSINFSASMPSWLLFVIIVSIGSTTILAIISGISYFFTKSESWQMVKQCFKDWKDKVCRPVIFIDSTKTKENPD